jgi:hypothetical protein
MTGSPHVEVEDGNDPYDLPPVVVTEDIDWEATTAEYVSLLGMSRRTPEQDERHFHLSRLVERRPPPWMTPAEQEEHLACIERTERAMYAAARRSVQRNARPEGDGRSPETIHDE